ncbi:MAG: hypothetical protein R3F37_19295 [Candidatus Competibacteraceae bacterium]
MGWNAGFITAKRPPGVLRFIIGYNGVGLAHAEQSLLIWLLVGLASLYWCYVLTWLRRYTITPQQRNPRLLWARPVS